MVRLILFIAVILLVFMLYSGARFNDGVEQIHNSYLERSVMSIRLLALMVVLLGASFGLVGAASPSAWYIHTTPSADVGWGSTCRFDTKVFVYYFNNNSASVDIQKAGQYISPTTNCDITGGKMYVGQGDGTVPTRRSADFPNPVSLGESWTVWWNQASYTYEKYGNWVHDFAGAGPYGGEGVVAGWDVYFLPNGNIDDYVSNAGKPLPPEKPSPPEASEASDIGKTVDIGGISVTVDRPRLSESESRIIYSYHSKDSTLVEPVGLPTIGLASGEELESSIEDVSDNGDHSWSSTIRFEAIPHGATAVTADLSSFLVYTSGSDTAAIPLGDHIPSIDPDEISERRTIPLDLPFSIGHAQYHLTALLLDPSNFVLVYEPANDIASRTVLGAGPSTVSLNDDHGGTYRSYLAGAGWIEAANGGQVVEYQGLYFEGFPNPDANLFDLRANGFGEVNGPFVFEVDLK